MRPFSYSSDMRGGPAFSLNNKLKHVRGLTKAVSGLAKLNSSMSAASLKLHALQGAIALSLLFEA